MSPRTRLFAILPNFEPLALEPKYAVRTTARCLHGPDLAHDLPWEGRRCSTRVDEKAQSRAQDFDWHVIYRDAGDAISKQGSSIRAEAGS
jgi:hypothetical protein